jgi:outer membrane cobalamin receptor
MGDAFNLTLSMGGVLSAFGNDGRSDSVISLSSSVSSVDKGEKTYIRYDPSCQISFRPLSNLNLYGGLGSYVRYPNMNQLFSTSSGNPMLKPEEAVKSELGLSYTIAGTLGSDYGLSIYYNDLKNFIDRDFAGGGSYQNLEGGWLKGIESRAEFYYGFMRMRASFDYIDAQSPDLLNYYPK